MNPEIFCQICVSILILDDVNACDVSIVAFIFGGSIKHCLGQCIRVEFIGLFSFSMKFVSKSRV